MSIRCIWMVVFLVLFLPMQDACGSRYMEPDLDAVGSSSLLIDLLNGLPVLIFLAFAIFNSRWQNVLRFLFLWLGLAWLLFIIGIPKLPIFWLAFGWFFLLFLSDHWVFSPKEKTEDPHKARKFLSDERSEENSLSSGESSGRPAESVGVNTEKPLDQGVKYKLLISCPSCGQRVRMRLGVGESVYIKCFSCGVGFNHKA